MNEDERRGRPGPKPKNRTRFVRVPVTVEEFEDVLLRAAKVGMKMPQFLRVTL